MFSLYFVLFFLCFCYFQHKHIAFVSNPILMRLMMVFNPRLILLHFFSLSFKYILLTKIVNDLMLWPKHLITKLKIKRIFWRARWAYDCQWVLPYKRFYTKNNFILFIRKLRALLVFFFVCCALNWLLFLSFHFAAFHTKSIFLHAVKSKMGKKRKA